jgi:muconolactone D-isomerase
LLFYVKGEMAGSVPLPAAEWLPIIVKNWETILQLGEEGKIVAGGKLAGRRGECAIFDVGSPDELDDLVRHLPLFPFLEWEVVPLRAVEDALESVKLTLEAITDGA